jgi:hypothetical protein
MTEIGNAGKDITPGHILLEKGEALYAKDLADAFSVLGVQSERIEIDARRVEEGRPIPSWSDADAFDRVLSPQRASLSELSDYAKRGFAFAQKLIEKLGVDLRLTLCKDSKVRSEILELESDTKAIIKYMASAVVGLVAVNLPAAVAGAAAAIATTLAIIIIKSNLQTFCATSSLALTPPSR